MIYAVHHDKLRKIFHENLNIHYDHDFPHCDALLCRVLG